ncbi:MAG: MBL fold metallo-hydrolase [Bacteroidetes bacterium]|jgi:glyoxylase-like metal-dependent hydrolase (beta-lactamase superfamily II)|nr:MBL fold metallo-hydrolase [Bacteroidota bacterium]
MNIGPYRITALETGRFSLDGGAMFGIVPWMFWSRTNPPDERQRIQLAARSLLIRGEGRTILVDDGNGEKWSDKLKDIYRLDTSAGDLQHSLDAAGVRPEDVTDVVLTHLHFDHAGGSTVRRHGRLVPAFPNATFYVQRDHWEWSKQPTDRDRASFMPDDYLPLWEAGVLELVDGQRELFPGIEMLVCNGHTTAQQLPKISDGTTTMLFCCDLIPTASHVPFPYIMGYDLRPLVTLEEKKRILPRAHDEGWILFLQHDPNVHAITLRSSDKGYLVDRTLSIE